MKYSKNQKLAKDFLRWLHPKENYEKWFVVNEGYSVGCTTPGKTTRCGPSWTSPCRSSGVAARKARMLGARRPGHGEGHEVYSKYIIVDMYAKAVQGMKAEDAVKWAEGELKKIYEG